MPPHQDLIPTLGYIRVSLAREEMISPEIQKNTIAAWAARSGRCIVDWVADLDRSGRNFRRKVMRAIERIEAREVREIAVYRYDRWGRNAVESLANCKRVEMVGGLLQSATEPFDIETGIGRYGRTNAFAIAELQSDQISDGWKGAHRNRVERGLTSSGTPRFGYVRLGRVLDPYDTGGLSRWRRDPDDPLGERYEPDYASGKADIHVEMYDHYQGHSFRWLVSWLNNRNILNARGRPWNDSTVRSVLDSGFAAGFLLVHSQNCNCGKFAACKNKTYEPGAHEAILDADAWAEYLAKRQFRATLPPRARYAVYPLSGLITCGHCFGPMTIYSAGYPTSQPGYGYRCSRWLHNRDCADAAFPRRVWVENEVQQQLAAWAADLDNRATITEQSRRAAAAAETDAHRLTRALADKDAALIRLTKQRAEDTVTPGAVYDATRNELLADRAQIEAELSRTQTTAVVNAQDFAPVLAELTTRWPVLPAMDRRDMLAKMIRHVTVRRVVGQELAVEVIPVWKACACPRCEPTGQTRVLLE